MAEKYKMHLIDAPYFVGIKSSEFKKYVEEIYSADFLSKFFLKLDITDESQKSEFQQNIKRIAVNYLTGKDMYSARMRPSEQKEVFEGYIVALKEVQRRFKTICDDSCAHTNFHNALKDVLRDSNINGLKEMFSPYVSVGDGNNSYGSTSDKGFIEFLDTLIAAAEKSPAYINEDDKADVESNFTLWWLREMGRIWNLSTKVPFHLGDYYKEIGLYKSVCLDVLYEILAAIDKNITKKNIETAMRKYKKYKLDQ